MTDQRVSLDVVVVTYRSADLIVACLDSVRAALADRFRLRVIVVDNDSPDDTVAVVRSRHPEVELVARTSNDGFSVGTNEGLRRTDADYVLMLNPDTELPDGVVDHLLDVLRADPSIGVISPRLERPDGSFDHASKRGFPDPVAAARYLLAKQFGRTSGSTAYLAPDVDERGFGFVDAVNGAFMLVPRAALDAVGLFDERYWMYAEDLDWCKRCALAGYRVAYDGRVSAVHVKGASAGTHRGLRTNWFFHTSMWDFYRRYNTDDGPVVRALVRAGIAGHWLVSTVRSAIVRRRLR